jgi:hypothetical protein
MTLTMMTSGQGRQVLAVAAAGVAACQAAAWAWAQADPWHLARLTA